VSQARELVECQIAFLARRVVVSPPSAGTRQQTRLAQGTREVVERCGALLTGADPHDEPDLLLYLGGRHARLFLHSGDRNYWPRTWAARAMLYAWDERAQPTVVAALADDAWRVREMAAKVTTVREIGAAAGALAGLLGDLVPRVRAAAARALAVVGEAEDADGLRHLLDDLDREVRRRAEQSLERLAVRLDRDLP
jgi:HEAT repeats